MAYREDLAEEIRELVAAEHAVEEKRVSRPAGQVTGAVCWDSARVCDRYAQSRAAGATAT